MRLYLTEIQIRLYTVLYKISNITDITALSSRPKLHELDLIDGPDGKTVRVLKDGASKWEHIYSHQTIL